MEWHAIIQGLLGSSPLAGALGFACYKLWAKLEQKDQTIQEKDTVIAELNEARVNDLRQISKPRP